MLQDPNVELYVKRQLKPLKAEIAKLKAEVKLLKSSGQNRVKKTAPILNISTLCVEPGCMKQSTCGDYCGTHCACSKKSKRIE